MFLSINASIKVMDEQRHITAIPKSAAIFLHIQFHQRSSLNVVLSEEIATNCAILRCFLVQVRVDIITFVHYAPHKTVHTDCEDKRCYYRPRSWGWPFKLRERSYGTACSSGVCEITLRRKMSIVIEVHLGLPLTRELMLNCMIVPTQSRRRYAADLRIRSG